MRLRLRWRYLLAVLLSGVALLAFALWRLGRDDERLTRWLSDSVQAATGLQMQTQGAGRFGFWPRLSIALDGVELVAAQNAGTPVRIDSMRAQVPWSSVFGRALRVSAIEIQGVTLDAQAIELWLAHRHDQGPVPALRWPQLDAALHVRDLRYQTLGSENRPIDSFVLGELRLNRWRIDQGSTLYAAFKLPALGDDTFRIELQCTPRQTRNSIAIEPCSAMVERGSSAPLALRGYFRHDDFARVESQLRIESARLPDWLNTAPVEFEPQPVDLALRLVGAIAGPLKAKLGGSLAGSAIDADVVLPFGWTDQIATRQWNALAEHSTGRVHIDKLRSADVVLDDIEWHNEPAAETAVTAFARVHGGSVSGQ